MTKIRFFEAAPEDAESLKAEIARHPELAGASADFTEERLDSRNAASAAGTDIVSVFIHSKLDKAAIDCMSGLKLISTRSTGFDHIDGAHARSCGIGVTNVPAYGSHTVAEFTFALMLSMSRRIWSGRENLRGFDLCGKTLGVVGTGRIGQRAIEIARGFGMEVVANDAYPDQAAASKLGFRYVSLDELLARSDVVTLHVPANAETKGLINRGNISKAKRGALLINTARGEVCDSRAVLWALDEGVLSGAGIDAREDELGDGGKELLSHPKAYVTPHMAYLTVEAQREIARVTVENIAAFLRGEPLNIVNR